jgi:hypothetical protein
LRLLHPHLKVGSDGKDANSLILRPHAIHGPVRKQRAPRGSPPRILPLP